MKKIIVCLLGFFCAACFISFSAAYAAAPKQLTFTKTSETKYPAKPKNEPVDLFYFSSKPDKPYDEIGELSGDITGGVLDDVLKAKTRQAGGDALIIAEISTRTENKATNLSVERSSRPNQISPVYNPGYSYKIYTVKSKVIKYK